jgi:hypothetical protein
MESRGLGEVLLGQPAARPDFHLELAADAPARAAYHALRTQVFVHRQGLFTGHDRDERDDDPCTLVLIARDRAGTVLGGVRLGPIDDGPDLGCCASRPPCRRAMRCSSVGSAGPRCDR